MRKKTVAIIGTNGLPGRYGGWDQLLNHLTLLLKDDFSIVVYTSSYNAVKGLKEYNGAKLKIIPLKANGLQSIFYDGISMLHAAFCYDVLLVLGTSGCIFLPLIRLFRKRIILNPDGQEWKRGKWSKPVQSFLKLSESFGIKFSNVVVADNKKIQEYIEFKYKKPSFLIEYGGDNVISQPMKEETAKKYNIVPGKYAFKVCRIEPENNIDLILEAFKSVPMNFVLVGNWNFSAYGRETRLKYQEYSNLLLLDPIYDQATLDELRSNCGLYIHGHSVGGTNPSLVEAMNLGLCCIVYDVEYNKETTENKAVYFDSSDNLKQIVENYITGNLRCDITKNELLNIAKKRYRWEIIITKYANLF